MQTNFHQPLLSTNVELAMPAFLAQNKPYIKPYANRKRPGVVHVVGEGCR